MTTARFAFVDATFAAETLGLGIDEILIWVRENRLKTYGGKERNPFLRMADVERVAAELGLSAQPPPSRRAADNPVKRVNLRLRADARWSQVGVEDLHRWAREADDSSKKAAKAVVETAMDRLRALLEVLSGEG